MRFKPVNRNLCLEPVEVKPKEEKKSAILVPDDYTVEESPYKVFKVLAVADDCKLQVSLGDKIVVDNTMTNLIELNEEKYYLLLENYVLAVL